MTLRGNCCPRTPQRASRCGWAGQLQEMLARRYKGRLARTSQRAPRPVLVRVHDPDARAGDDIVVVDYVQNDDRQPWRTSDSTPLDVQASVATERFLRKLKDYFDGSGSRSGGGGRGGGGKNRKSNGGGRKRPLPVVLFFLSYPPPGFSTTPAFRNMWRSKEKSRRMRQIMWDHHLNYAQVLHHYGVPYVTLQSILWAAGPDEMPTPASLWKSELHGGHVDKHPGWPVHRACADAMFHALQLLEQDARCRRRRRSCCR